MKGGSAERGVKQRQSPTYSNSLPLVPNDRLPALRTYSGSVFSPLVTLVAVVS